MILVVRLEAVRFFIRDKAGLFFSKSLFGSIHSVLSSQIEEPQKKCGVHTSAVARAIFIAEKNDNSDDYVGYYNQGEPRCSENVD